MECRDGKTTMVLKTCFLKKAWVSAGYDDDTHGYVAQGLPMVEDLELREVHETDLPVLFEHQRDPVAIQMAGYRPRSLEAFMEHWAKILTDSSVVKMTILCQGKIAGNILVFDVGENRTIGYWLGNAYWGRGVATAALMDVLGQVADRPLYAYVAAHNIASQRVLKKCGFGLLGRVDTPEGFSRLAGEELLVKLDVQETAGA